MYAEGGVAAARRERGETALPVRMPSLMPPPRTPEPSLTPSAAGLDLSWMKSEEETGDIVRRRPDGVLEFLGRNDRQVKVRGHRIELDEVEAALASHEGVVEAAVVLSNDGEMNVGMHAAVTTSGESAPAELIDYVRTLLPWYAVPERIEILQAFPRTSTGKIDRRRLGQLIPQS